MVSMLMPRVRRVRIRTRASNRDFALGAILRFGCLPAVKLNPRNFRSHGRATALFSRFTFSLSLPSRSLVSPSIRRWPARGLRALERVGSRQQTVMAIEVSELYGIHRTV